MKFRITPQHLMAFFVFVVILGIGETVRAQKVCYQCHEKSAFQKKVIHQPVTKGECTACHNPHVAKHAGMLQDKVSDLCYSCHQEESKSFRKGIMHDPVRQGNCTACHDPHASNDKGLMKGEFGDSCLTCHTTLSKKYKTMHKPYAKGECSSCHDPHRADNYMLLKTSAQKICRKCHSSEKIATVHKNFPAKIEGCLTCHNPHGSDHNGLIRNVQHEPYTEDCGTCHVQGKKVIGQEVCLECHDEIKTGLLAVHNHLTEREGNSCINCHSPHAGNTENLLKSRQILLCRSCHDDTFRKHDETLYVHIASVKDCVACHEVHGSNQAAMVKGDGNKMCLQCHEDQGQFSHPVGEGVIDPRNSQVINCVSCHHPHGTNFKGELKLSGQEDLCIQCHRL